MPKIFTTPTIRLRLESDGAEELLKNAEKVILSMKGVNQKGNSFIDFEPEISGNTVSYTLSQKDSEILGVGVVKVEVTIKMPEDEASRVYKTVTTNFKITESIRDEEL